MSNVGRLAYALATMHTTLGGLRCVVFPESQSPAQAVVVLCHGFGASGDDLVGLHAELLALRPELARARFIFPEAPLELGAAMGFGGRAWWLIDFEQIQAVQAGDRQALLDFRQKEPEGMAHARKLFTALVLEAAAATGLPLSKFVLGGFSQGAMLATDVALRLEEPPAGLVALSGTLLLEDLWAAKAKARAGLKVFQSHGRQDPLLPFWVAERLKDLLVASGHQHTWAPFEGGHGIPMEVLRALATFLAERLSP